MSLYDRMFGPSRYQFNRKMEEVMATLEQLKDAVAAEAAEVKAHVDALAAEVQALKDQIANGGTVTEADLDQVLTDINNIFTTPSTPGGGG